jgi:1-acyl-sn-glycerol-3-phosphate acyltransferase
MSVFDKDSNPFDEQGIEDHVRQALAVEKPSGFLVDQYYRALNFTFKPTLYGTDNIPDRPCLFVANHALFAFDGLIFLPMMLKKMNRFVRSMGDKVLWNSVTEKMLLKSGGIIGHPEVCTKMMENGHDLLVFPGGAHEACKDEDNYYNLMWKERYGFVKLAAQHGYTIMPVGFVGPDDFFKHRIEGQDLPETRLGKVMTQLGFLSDKTRKDLLPPIPSGVFGSLLPKPYRVYIKFGKAIDLAEYKGQTLSKPRMHSIRSEVAAEIEDSISDLLEIRDSEKGNESLLRRFLTR